MYIKMASLIRTTLDKIGIAASSICALHCALAPLLITIAPLVGLGFVFEERFETIFILSSLGIAFLSLVWGFYKSHRKFEPFYLLLLGTSLIVISRMETPLSFLPEPLLMFCGGLSIAISHYINLKLCNHCKTCEH
jgi:hypothetical protein